MPTLSVVYLTGRYKPMRREHVLHVGHESPIVAPCQWKWSDIKHAQLAYILVTTRGTLITHVRLTSGCATSKVPGVTARRITQTANNMSLFRFPRRNRVFGRVVS